MAEKSEEKSECNSEMIAVERSLDGKSDWIKISGRDIGYLLHPDEAMDMARIIMDLVCDIRHEQGPISQPELQKNASPDKP